MIRFLAATLTGWYLKLFCRHKVYGKLGKEGGILAANHASYMDPPIMGTAAYPVPVHFLARDSLFTNPVGRWFLGQLKAYPLKRGRGNSYLFKQIIGLLQKGGSVGLFPEGTRTKDGEFQDPKLGLGYIVEQSNCLVYPIYIHGTFDVWGIERKRPKLFGKTACVIGKPLRLNGLGRKEITLTIMEAIKQLKVWYLNGAKGTPP